MQGGNLAKEPTRYQAVCTAWERSASTPFSEWFEAEVRKDGKIHQMSFSQGITTKKLAVIGETKKTGTKISFKPDPVIFLETRTFQYDILAKRLALNSLS